MRAAAIERHLWRFHEALDAERYWLCCGEDPLQKLVSGRGAALLGEAWQRGRLLSDNQRTLLLVFFFGSEAPAEALSSVLGTAVCSTLVELGLMSENGSSFRAEACAVVPYCGQYLFVPQMAASPAAQGSLYVGADSLRLIEASRRTLPARCLFEVGAGTGIVGLAGGTGGAYFASEIDPWAALVAQVNFMLNRATDRCAVVCGDLYEGCPPSGVDLVLANPPYLPEPPESSLPGFAGGGGDGLAMVREILRGLPSAGGGSCRCLLALRLFGGASGPLAIEEELATSAPGSVVVLLDRAPLRRRDFLALARGTGDTALQADFAGYYQAMGYSHQYDALVTVPGRYAAGAAGVRVIRCFDMWDDDSIPIPTLTGFPDPTDSLDACVMKLADGHSTVAQIAGKEDFQEGLMVSSMRADRFAVNSEMAIEACLMICRRLELAGFLRGLMSAAD